RREPGAAILRTLAPLPKPLLLQTVHQVGDPSARDQDLALNLAQPPRPLAAAGLEDPELREGACVSRAGRPGVRLDRGKGPRKHDEEFERPFLFFHDDATCLRILSLR